MITLSPSALGYFDENTVRKSVVYTSERFIQHASIAEDVISARVQGTELTPYTTKLYLELDGRIAFTECTCPVGESCKHAAALCTYVLYYPQRIQGYSGMHSNTDKTKSAWQQQLTSVLPVTEDLGSYDYCAEILFWVTPVTSNLGLLTQPRLALRLLDNNTGKYLPLKNSWKDFEGPSYGGKPKFQISPLQTKFVKGLISVYHQTTKSYYGVPHTWIELESNSMSTWLTLLSHHSAHNTKILMGEKGTEGVLVYEKQPIRPVLTVNTHADGLIVEHRLKIGEVVLDSGSVNIMGFPPAMAILPPENTSNLHGTSKETLPVFTLHPFIEEGDFKGYLQRPVVVPKKDVKEFEEQYLSNFTQRQPVESLTKDFLVPERISPNLAVNIQINRGKEIKITWEILYEGVPLKKDSKSIIYSKGKKFSRSLRTEEVLIQFLYDQLKEHVGNFVLLDEERRVTIIAMKHGRQVVRKVVPVLQKMEDVTVEIAENVPSFEDVYVAPEVSMDVSEERNRDWFNLAMRVRVDGEEVIFGELFMALAQNEDSLLLPSGRLASLLHPEFIKLKKIILSAETVTKNIEDGNFSVTRFQVGWYEELKKLGNVARETAAWQEAVSALRLDSAPVLLPQPIAFNGTLRNYQLDGYSWMHTLYTKHLGGVLADEMGLGKTVQTISLLLKIQEQNPNFSALIIAPTSVVENWEMELQKFSPTLSHTVLRSGDRSAQLKSLSKYNIVVTSFALLIRDFEYVKDVEWECLILDEAQNLKNYNSRGYFLVRQLRAQCRFALTGTPMENNLNELWSILSLTAPGLFPSLERFGEHFRRPIEKQSDALALGHLRARIKPFMLRRKKDLVEKDLPARVEQVLPLEMPAAQRKIYDAYLNTERKRVLGLLAEKGGLQKHRFTIFSALMRLRQLCLHPGLVDGEHLRKPSAKIDSFLELLEEIVSGEHKVLVFSQFTSFLTLVREALGARKVDYLYLDGATKKRGELIKKFESVDGPPVFLISLKAGGSGLNLTAADYCILLDPWWNPAVEDQAIARAHRIGQKKTVNVYRLIIKDSIEEKVLKLQEKKRKLFSDVLEDGEMFAKVFNEEDIKNLFEI